MQRPATAIWTTTVYGISWLILLLPAHASMFLKKPISIPANATIDITITPQAPWTGQTVSLVPEGKFPDVISCFWLKVLGDYFTPILIYQLKPTMEIHYQSGYNSRQSPDDDCSLHIEKVSQEDMGLYVVLIQRKNDRIEYGEDFLLVQEQQPETPKPIEIDKGLSTNTIVRIVLACIATGFLVVMVAAYQIIGKPKSIEPTWTLRPYFEDRPNQHRLGQRRSSQEASSSIYSIETL